MSLNTTIKSIQDIMRKDVGVDGDAQRIGQLVWLLFLKIWDDREKELELMESDFVSPLVNVTWQEGGETRHADDLRWSAWAADPEGITGDKLLDFADNTLFPALKDIEVGPEIEGDDAEARAAARPAPSSPAGAERLRGRLPVHEVGHADAAGHQQDSSRHRLQRRQATATSSATSTRRSSRTSKARATRASTTRHEPSPQFAVDMVNPTPRRGHSRPGLRHRAASSPAPSSTSASRT